MNINEKLQVIIDKQLKEYNEYSKIIKSFESKPEPTKDEIDTLYVLKKEFYVMRNCIADLQWIKGNINEQSK